MKKSAKCSCVVAKALVALMGLFLLAAPLSAAPPALPKEISIATYPTGSIGYMVSSGLAKLIAVHTPMKAIPKPMAGPTIWDVLLDKGEIDIAVAGVAPDLYRAYRGLDEYKERHRNLRHLSYIYEFCPTNLVVRADSNIKRISQIKGKRVTSDFAGIRNIVRQMEVSLASAGLTWDDVVKVPVPDIITSVKALREGRVDVAFTGTATQPAAVELSNDIPIYSLPLEPGPRLEKALKELLPGSDAKVQQPAGFVREPTLSFVLPFYVTASAHLSEAAAYEIVKALWENYKEMQPVHVLMKNFSPDKMIMMKEPPIPYHPGAIRLYKEKGVWTKELDDAQKRLLKL